MAVNFYNSAANPSAVQFTWRGLFSCCYGGKQQKRESPGDEYKAVAKDEDLGHSDESDEEIRQNFVRARQNSIARTPGSRPGKERTDDVDGRESVKGDGPPNGESRLSSEHELSTPSEKKITELKGTSGIMEEQFAKYGILHATFAFDHKKGKLIVTVLQVQDIPSMKKGGHGSYQVRLTLMPQKRVRFKTKIRQGESPFFEEMFQFQKIMPEDVGELAIRFRLYNVEKLKRERAVSETVFNLSNLNLHEEKTYNLILASSSELKSGYGTSESQLDLSSDVGSTSASMASINMPVGDPEILLGLTYNGTTGRLAVEVMKGSALRAPGTNKPPDSYVTVVLMSANGQTLAHSKTSVRKGQPNPLFRETFMFQVAQFQLTDISLMVNVYNKRAISRKEMIGWFCIGLNSSGEEEMLHWEDMKQAHGEQVARWHILQESSS